MNSIRAGLSLVLILTGALVVPAGDTPAKLPKDGSWVRYYVVVKQEGANTDESSLKSTYSLVGTTVERGQTCRWVEVKSKYKFDGRDKIDILKFLVPEKELLEGERPLNSLVRTWRKIDDGAAKPMSFETELGVEGTYFSRLSADFAFGRDMFIFPGPQQKSKVVDERKVVEYQRGRLEIARGLAGRHISSRLPRANGQKKLTFALEFTVWNDPSLALGCAAASNRFEDLTEGVAPHVVVSEWIMEDFGDDAKSAMPDNI